MRFTSITKKVTDLLFSKSINVKKESLTMADEQEAMIKEASKFDKRNRISSSYQFEPERFRNAMKAGQPDYSYTDSKERVAEAVKLLHNYVTKRIGKGGVNIKENSIRVHASKADIKDPNLNLIDRATFAFDVDFYTGKGVKKIYAAVEYDINKDEKNNVYDFALTEDEKEIPFTSESLETYLAEPAKQAKEARLIYYNVASNIPYYETLDVKDAKVAKAILEKEGFEVRAGWYGSETGINGQAYEVVVLPEKYETLHKVLAQEFKKLDWPDRSFEKGKLPYKAKDWADRSLQKQPLADKDLIQSVQKKDWADRSLEKVKPVNDEGLLKYEKKQAQADVFVVDYAGRKAVIGKSDVLGLFVVKEISNIDIAKINDKLDTKNAKDLVAKIDPSKVDEFSNWASGVPKAPEPIGQGLPAIAQKFVGKDAPEQTGDKMSGAPSQSTMKPTDFGGTKWIEKPEIAKTEKEEVEKKSTAGVKKFEDNDKPNIVSTEKEEAPKKGAQKFVGKDAPETKGDVMSGMSKDKQDVPDMGGTKWERELDLPSAKAEDKSGMQPIIGEVKLPDFHKARLIQAKSFREAQDIIIEAWDIGDISTDESLLITAQLKQLDWPDRSSEKQPWKGDKKDWPERSLEKGSKIPVKAKEWDERSLEKYTGKPKDDKMMISDAKKSSQLIPELKNEMPPIPGEGTELPPINEDLAKPEGKPEIKEKPELKLEKPEGEEKEKTDEEKAVCKNLQDAVKEIMKKTKVSPEKAVEEVVRILTDDLKDENFAKDLAEEVSEKPAKEKKEHEPKEKAEKPEKEEKVEEPEEKKEEKEEEEPKEGKPKKNLPPGLQKFLEDKKEKKEAVLEEEQKSDAYKPSKGMEADKKIHEPMNEKEGKSDQEATDTPNARSVSHDEIYKHKPGEYAYPKELAVKTEKAEKKIAVQANPELGLTNEKMHAVTDQLKTKVTEVGQERTSLDDWSDPESVPKERAEEFKQALLSPQYVAEKIVRSVSKREYDSVKDGYEAVLKSEALKNISEKQKNAIRAILQSYGFSIK